MTLAIGKKFGRLTIEADTGRRCANGHRIWLARCGCGTPVERWQFNPNNACACRACVCADISRARTSHGVSQKKGSPAYATYIAWCSMRWRCTNKARRDYPDYGGRGITICARWALFENFLEDMGIRPAGLSIDRIDNSGNYEPGNCRWATGSEQARNKRSNRVIEHDGERLTLVEWARRTGLPRSAITNRIKAGWSVSKAMTTPLGPTSVRRGASA